MITLRKALDDDIPILKLLYNNFIEEMNRFDPSDPTPEQEILQWINMALSGDKSILFLALNDEKIVGFTRLQHKKRKAENEEIIYYAKLSDLYILPEARQKGIARLLIKKSFDWAKQNLLPEIILNVYETNQSAHALYKALGFIDDSHISNERIRMKYILPSD